MAVKLNTALLRKLLCKVKSTGGFVVVNQGLEGSLTPHGAHVRGCLSNL